jgi:ABC-type branched-subunit amino acid transport system ATPase component/ABC-type branched-subunit amino acid transport system permease subunit
MPDWLTPATAVSLSIAIALTVAALALNMLVAHTGQLSLGHGALLGVGAFSGSMIVDRLHGPMLVGWVAAAVAGALASLMIGLPALRLRGAYLALVTLIFALTMQASVLRWSFFTNGAAGVLFPRRLWRDHLLSGQAAFLSVCLVTLALVWQLDRNVLRTKVGRAFGIIRENETAAQAFGVDVVRYKLLAFVTSGALAGLAGAVYASGIGLVSSDVFPLELSLKLLLIVILAGAGSRASILVVAIVLQMGPQYIHWFSGWDLVVAGVVTLYNVVRVPGGLASIVREIRHRRESGGKRRVPALSDVMIPSLPMRSASHQVPGRPSATPTVLSARGVTVRFGGLVAVDQMNLDVHNGQIVGLIGPNGAGKSTLFNALSGLVRTESGEILVSDVAVHDRPAHARARAGLGRTMQQVGLAKLMTVRENILLAQHLAAGYGAHHGMFFSREAQRRETELRAIADAVIDDLGFSRYADTLVGRLSGGQQRIVELAAVLSTQPSLLMLDEPTAGLSPAASENLAERLRELRDGHGQAILLIEHNVPLVLDLCDYVYVMNAGVLLAAGTPQELAQSPEVLAAYLGEAA